MTEEMFLAEFDGRALFTTLEAAQGWCDRRAAARWPGREVEWPDEPDESKSSHPGQVGQVWYWQRWASEPHPDPTASLGHVIRLVPDVEAAPVDA